ncbi:MAG: hypothetical protein EBU75_12840, partial [Betaproteobacteria bacterium]|nr:hypothetical protein [Betaproteobacteria bacterium]
RQMCIRDSLWIVYSSGTTGLPKPIVHGHGGILLEMLKGGVLHNNLGPSALTGDRFHWFSSTGWIMWNAGIGGLLGGTTLCIFDGSPSGPSKMPDWSVLWRFAALTGLVLERGVRDQKWNVGDLVKKRHAVFAPPIMLSQQKTMVSAEDQRGVFPHAVTIHIVQQAAKIFVAHA